MIAYPPPFELFHLWSMQRMMTAASCPKPNSRGLVNSYWLAFWRRGAATMRAMEPFHFFPRFLFETRAVISSLSTHGPGRQLCSFPFFIFQEKKSSLPESGTTLHLIISSPSRHTGSFWRFWYGKNDGLDASCRVYREPYNLYWEEPTESGGYRFLFPPAFHNHTTFCYTRSTKKLGGVDHQASFFSHIGIPPSFPFSFLTPMCSILALRLPFLTERYPHTIIPHLSHPPSPLSDMHEEKKRAFMQDKR